MQSTQNWWEQLLSVHASSGSDSQKQIGHVIVAAGRRHARDGPVVGVKEEEEAAPEEDEAAPEEDEAAAPPEPEEAAAPGSDDERLRCARRSAVRCLDRRS